MFLEEQHANMSKMRIYFVIVFLIGLGVLLVLYLTFYLSLQRTASERMFTFQLTTLIPFESLEFLASEARRKVNVILAEQQQGGKRGGGGSTGMKFNTEFQLGFSGLSNSTNGASGWLGVSTEDQSENSQRSSRAPTPLSAAVGVSKGTAAATTVTVSYTHLRAHETPEHLVCRLLLEKKKKIHNLPPISITAHNTPTSPCHLPTHSITHPYYHTTYLDLY
eukprot:TRINITY_DN25144_c0_g2_i1.p1 TRINITY_DN25144_c0_g2~~TRINITY_DN25144_c0_g2_i1.p1  ORF type:complete len:221 (+),score=40.80 TRINITY_DN25144_c0_g2_i1:155-817(+)